MDQRGRPGGPAVLTVRFGWFSVPAVPATDRPYDLRSLVSWRWFAAALLSVTACGAPCPRLSKALCDGGEAAYCAQVDEWLAGRLIDPETKEPLQGAPRDQMCTAIHGSVDIFNAYRFKAKQKLLGEPDFTVASSTPAANKADPTPPTPPTKNEFKTGTTITTPPAKVDQVPDPAKDDDAKDEAKPDDSIKPDDRPDDGEEDKPAANMSD